MLSIRATSRQHEKVQEFLDQVVASATRQVLIEATILEVSPATCKTNRDGGNTVSCRTGDTFRTVRSREYSPSCPGWRR